MESHKPTHVVLLASPGLGHLIPVIELAKCFISHHFKVTVLAITTPTSDAQSQILKSTCDIIEIPAPDISRHVSADTSLLTQLCLMMREAKPAIRSVLSNMTVCPSALIVDIFGTESLSIAQEFNILNYVYVASHAWFLSFVVYSPVLDRQIKGPYMEQKQPLKIPGCKSVKPEELSDTMFNRNNVQYEEHLGIGKRVVKSNGILVNTWEELQGKDLHSLREGELKKKLKVIPDVYAIGPVVRQHVSGTSQVSNSEVVTWLDKQPSESVIYVSFGSGGTMSLEQMVELAWGLELSGRRFVWVVRAPTEGVTDAAYIASGSGGNEISKYLPEGFVHRTRDMGILVPQWAPQVTILSHPSVGGFLSHCGWSSTLESITKGVPMIAWPLYAEQKMNATLLTEELGVAVRPSVLPTKKVVGREEIAKMVKKVITGDKNVESKMRKKVKEIQRSAVKALSEGGSSYVAFTQVAKTIEKSRQVN